MRYNNISIHLIHSNAIRYISNAQGTGQRDLGTEHSVYWELLLLHTCTLLLFSDLGSIDRHWLDRSKYLLLLKPSILLKNSSNWLENSDCSLSFSSVINEDGIQYNIGRGPPNDYIQVWIDQIHSSYFDVGWMDKHPEYLQNMKQT